MIHTTSKKEYINISDIIKNSQSDILKKLPGFIIRWIKTIIKQDEINRVLAKYEAYTGIDFLPKMIEEFNLNLEIEGKENLPENGKCFFVSNHPFGVIDGLVLTYIVSEKYGDFKAIGNDAFLFLPQLRPLIAAVNVYGYSNKEYIKALDEVFNSDIPITHFPAGEVSRKYHGKIQDREWQKSFITKSISCHRNVVPFYMYGKNSKTFYFIYMLRQLFGIKQNLELMLLPREMFKKRNSTIKVKIGKPISYESLQKETNHWDGAQKIRALVYELEKK